MVRPVCDLQEEFYAYSLDVLLADVPSRTEIDAVTKGR
jgi:hypothetical protein